MGRHVSTSQHPRSMQCSCCTLGGHACVCMCRRRAAAGGGGVGQAGGDQGAKAAGAAQPPEGQEVDQGALPGWRWGPVLCRSPTADGSRQRVAGCFSGSGVPATHDAPSHTTRACHRACTSSHTACTLLTLSPVPTPRRMWTCLRRTTSLFRSTRRCTGASWWSATQVGQPAAGLSAGTGARQGVAEGTPSSCVAAACVPRISGMPPNDCCAAGVVSPPDTVQIRPGDKTACILHLDSLSGGCGAGMHLRLRVHGRPGRCVLCCGRRCSCCCCIALHAGRPLEAAPVGLPSRCAAACLLAGAGSHRSLTMANRLRLYLQFEWHIKVGRAWVAYLCAGGALVSSPVLLYWACCSPAHPRALPCSRCPPRPTAACPRGGLRRTRARPAAGCRLASHTRRPRWEGGTSEPGQHAVHPADAAPVESTFQGWQSCLLPCTRRLRSWPPAPLVGEPPALVLFPCCRRCPPRTTTATAACLCAATSSTSHIGCPKVRRWPQAAAALLQCSPSLATVSSHRA